MKTPREVLLNRHRAIEPKLDEIRRSVCASGRRAAPRPSVWAPLFALPALLWRELIFPSRRMWAALSAAWMVLIVLNVAQRDKSTLPVGAPAPVMLSFQEQQRIMRELFADRTTSVEAEPAHRMVPRPRTEVMNTFIL